MTDNDISDKDDPLYTRRTLLRKASNPSDESAWSEFNSYYRSYIYNVVRGMGLAHHDADEVVQLTLVKIWNAMPSFKYSPSKGRFRGWICKIARNAAKNFLRAKGPIPLPLSSVNWDSDENDFSVQPEAEEYARKEWERYLPELALKRISSHFDRRTMQAFVLFTHGISIPEIAKRLQLAESSIYVYKQRVQIRLTDEIARLRKELE